MTQVQLEKKGIYGFNNIYLCTIHEDGTLCIEKSTHIQRILGDANIRGLPLKNCCIRFNNTEQRIRIKYKEHTFEFRLPENKFVTKQITWNALVTTIHTICSGYNQLKYSLNGLSLNATNNSKFMQMFEQKLEFDIYVNGYMMKQLLDMIACWDSLYAQILKPANSNGWTAKLKQVLSINRNWHSLLQEIKKNLNKVFQASKWRQWKESNENYTINQKINEYTKVEKIMLLIATKTFEFTQLIASCNNIDLRIITTLNVVTQQTMLRYRKEIETLWNGVEKSSIYAKDEQKYWLEEYETENDKLNRINTMTIQEIIDSKDINLRNATLRAMLQMETDDEKQELESIKINSYPSTTASTNIITSSIHSTMEYSHCNSLEVDELLSLKSLEPVEYSMTNRKSGNCSMFEANDRYSNSIDQHFKQIESFCKQCFEAIKSAQSKMYK